jgi:hypothetical protein
MMTGNKRMSERNVRAVISELMVQTYVNWAITGFQFLTADAVFRQASKMFHLQYFIQTAEGTPLELKPLVEEFCSINWPSFKDLRDVNPRLTAINFLKQYASKLPVSQGSVLRGYNNQDSFVKQAYLKVNAMHVELCRVHEYLWTMEVVRDAIRAIKTKLADVPNADITTETNVVFDAFDSEEVGFTLFLDILSAKSKKYKNSASSPATKRARIEAVIESISVSSAVIGFDESSAALNLVEGYGDDEEDQVKSSPTLDENGDDDKDEAESSLTQEALQQEESSLTEDDCVTLKEYQKTVQLGDCRLV